MTQSDLPFRVRSCPVIPMPLPAILALFAIIPVVALAVAFVLVRSRDKAALALQASEEKFARIFQTSPDAINVAAQVTGVCLDLNDSYEKLFGYSRQEVIGRSVLPGDLGIWASAADRERFVAALRAEGKVTGFEAPLRRKDGSVFTALISSSVMEIDGVTCNLSLTRDISERKRVEEELRESAQRLELAAQSGSLGIWDLNLRDKTMVWNDRMYELYGVDRATFRPTQASWEQLVLPEDRMHVRDQAELASREARPCSMVFRAQLPDGGIRHLGANLMVIRDPSGQPMRMLGVVRDRTEQVRAEDERRRLQEERQHSEKLESLGSLAGGMAHDMNNVLAGILGTAELLRLGCPEGDPAAKPLDSILHAAGRGRDLVRALTDFARKGLAEPQLVDINDLVRKEVDLLRHATLQKVQVILDLDPHLPPVMGDASALGGTLMNLGVNALDAMPDGGTLTFRTRVHPSDRIEVDVIDTGVGMPTEILVRAMEPFFTTKPAGKGTGLGLARVYGTMKAHGGSVEIRSAPGRGTTIVLRLPGFRQAKDTGPAPEPAEPKAALRRSLSILFVDDDPVILDTIPPLVQSLGHTVSAASRGEEALAQLDGGLAVDLVVLDHNMPGLTGTETLMRLRESRPDLPVILATGFVDSFTENLVTSLPGVWILNKPYSLAQLRKAIGVAVASGVGV